MGGDRLVSRVGAGVLLVALLAAAVVANVPSRATPGPPRHELELVLREEFDGRKLQRKRWRTCHWWASRGCTIASNHELEAYHPEQVRVRDGVLRLVAERRRVPGQDGRRFPYASGMISSGPGRRSPAKFAFRYGRAEIRARPPVGRGLWSAIWMLPANRSSKPEIDIMESLGHAPDTAELHVHWADGDDVEQRGRSLRLRGLRHGWHTYAIDWRPDRLTWLIDGKVLWRVRGDAVPDTPMYLVANLAVGGDWPGAPDSSTRFPSAFLIDSIKVWQ